MKAAAGVLVCWLALLLLHVSQAHAAPPFAGTWVNVDKNTASITRLEITEEADGWVIHAWGKCGPPDCDWGSVPLHLARGAAELPGTPLDRLRHGVAYWDHHERDKGLDMRTFMTLHAADGELVVESFDVFGKASGHTTNVRMTDSFKRAR